MAIQKVTKAHSKKSQINTKNGATAETQTKPPNNRNKSTPVKNIPNSASLTSSLQRNDGKLPEFLQHLLEGNEVCGDSGVSFQKPDWYDDEKFKRGQKFATDYIFGAMFAHMLSVIVLLLFKGAIQPLIYTGNSDTPYKSFKLYLSTALRVKSWSDTDIWKKGSKGNTNLKQVKAILNKIRNEMTKEPQDDIAKKVTLEGKPMWTEKYEEITGDLASSCPMLKHPLEGPEHVYVNQTDMAVTQFAFVGLILVYPNMFGIHGATKKDLDGFAHFWRTIGYLLGIEDRFNLCGGDLSTVQQRCQDLLQYWVKPCLRQGSHDWFHMSRCVTEGISYYVNLGTDFEVVFLYLCRVISIDAARLEASLNVLQATMFNFTCFIYSYLLRVPGIRPFVNWLIELAIKKGENFPPEILDELQQKVYPYEQLSENYH